jgi:hypothetical protein
MLTRAHPSAFLEELKSGQPACSINAVGALDPPLHSRRGDGLRKAQATELGQHGAQLDAVKSSGSAQQFALVPHELVEVVRFLGQLEASVSMTQASMP